MAKISIIVIVISCCLMAVFNKCSGAQNPRLQTPLSKNILDFEPLHITLLQKIELEKKLKISFSAFRQDFDITLYHSPSFSHDAAVISLNPDGSENLKAPISSLSYRTKDHTAALTLDGEVDDVVRGIVEKGNNIFHILSEADVHDSMEVFDNAKVLIERSGAKLLIFRDTDIISDPDKAQFCGGIDSKNTTHQDWKEGSRLPVMKPEFPLALNRIRRDRAVYPPPRPCPSKPINLNMGFVADHSFLESLQKHKQTFSSWLDVNVNIISAIYLKTFHTTITVSFVYEAPKADSHTWNKATCSDIYEKLSEFSKWRGTSTEVKTRREGLFHLMSSCYKSGAIGLAFRDVLCMTDATSHDYGWQSGTGISSGRGIGWKILAHEMGHQFGAGHDRGGSPVGIMHPSSSASEVFTRRTQRKVCQFISKTMGPSMACFNNSPNCTASCPKNCGKYGCCGDDGCGDTCGSCSVNGYCSAGICKCIPNCNGRLCGDDGCGGQCGKCKTDELCISSQCVEHTSTAKLYIIPQNEERARYNVKPIKWSTLLESQASEMISKKCARSSKINDDFGYNSGIWKFSKPPSSNYIIERSVGYWLNQGKKWTCPTDSCKRGGSCREYTQIIHENVTSMGCSYGYCPNSERHHVICIYDYNGKLDSSKPFESSRCLSGLTSLQICQQSSSCESAHKQCGTYFNGCDIEDCGECFEGSTCKNNVCQCAPKTSCAAQMKTCDTIDIGCGITENCGSCDGEQPCHENRCETCLPVTTCEEQNRTCGVMNNGCEKISCGACIEGQDCMAGKCSPCSNCHDLAICENMKCKCSQGFEGDGYTCRPIGDILNGDTTDMIRNSWVVKDPFNVWIFKSNLLEHTASRASTAIDIAFFNEITSCSENSITSWSLNILKMKTSSNVGIVFTISLNTYIVSWYDPDENTFKLGINIQGKFHNVHLLAENVIWPDNTAKTIHIDIVGRAGMTILFNGKKYPFSFNGLYTNLCQFGAYSEASAQFSDIISTSKSRLNMILTDRILPDEFLNKIAYVLEISVDQISDISFATSNDNNPDGQINRTTYTFTLTGSELASATSLASKLISTVAQQSSLLDAAGLVATSASIIVPNTSAGARVLSLRAEGFSSFYIAIIMGNLVAIIIIIAGVVYVKKQRSAFSSKLYKNMESI